MAIALIIGKNEQERKNLNSYIKEWQQALLAQEPNLDLRTYPDIGDANEIEYILVVSAQPEIFKEFPHAKVIFALAAGVDDILTNSSWNSSIRLVRINDPFMAQDICQYAVTYVLHNIKRVHHWQNLQKQHVWGKEVPYPFPNKVIGVMGLGYLGEKVASSLTYLGFPVNGWSRSPKEINNVTVYKGKAEFDTFLQHTDILICLLPLTNKTRHILNQDSINQLPKGAYIINMGRGDHLVEKDLLAALDSGQLSGATLDVFPEEPLPANHVLWDHPKIIITPHIASVTHPATAAVTVIENLRRVQNGEPPAGEVDFTRGY